MNKTEFWKNFQLGVDLNISGAFIYNGLRRFHELRQLDHTEDIFEVLYQLSIGIERLLKIAIVLLEHDETMDQEKFETSLITHSHLDLLARIKKHHAVQFGPTHNEFLALLSKFYRTFRYDRFSLGAAGLLGKERDELLAYLSKHLAVKFSEESIFGNYNDDRYRQFLRKTVLKIASTLYAMIKVRAGELNLYTYELRNGSKAETVFLGDADIPAEDVLWKELLIFFMNTQSTSGCIKFLREIEPLGFDPGLTGDYLDCFQSDSAKAQVIDELETLYEDLPNKSERLQMMGVIGSPNVDFDDDDDEEEDSEGFKGLDDDGDEGKP